MAGIFPLLVLLLQCSWGTPVEIGTLDPVIKESSGLAISRRIPNRAYRHNDSGDSGRFFVTDLAGRNVKTVNIAAFKPKDLEGVGLGPCDAATDCLFFADTGDNERKRENPELVVVREQPSFAAEVKADYRVSLRYPDGQHDVEAIAVHPDGNVYIATKDPRTLQIFRLKRDQWRLGKGPQTLELVVTLSWSALLPTSLPLGRVATSMDIAADGQRFILLTYVEAVEFFIDLSKPVPDTRAWKAGQQYRRIPLTTLEQQEAIAYLPDGRGFIYESERAIDARPAKVMRVSCPN
jgi:hypothetical protein